MATAKKPDPADKPPEGPAESGSNRETVEARRKAREDAENQMGVEPPDPDVNETPA